MKVEYFVYVAAVLLGVFAGHAMMTDPILAIDEKVSHDDGSEA